MSAFAQQVQDSITTKQLKEVIVSSTRIDLLLSENARSIQVITKENIQQAGVTTVADLLQQVAGIDIRRRGIAGTQADLYICLLYTSPSPRDLSTSRMPSSA